MTYNMGTFYLQVVSVLAICYLSAFVETTTKILQDDSIMNFTIKNFDVDHENGESLNEIVILKGNSTVVVAVTGIPANVSFIILQSHAQYNNITLSLYEKLSPGSAVTGKNVGLVQVIIPKQMDAVFYLSNPNNNDMEVLLAVQAYNNRSPVPGGCNMEFPVEISPFLILGNLPSMISVKAQPAASHANVQYCEDDTPIDIKIYRLYLEGNDFTSTTYFSSIQKMMTMKDILIHGEEIPKAVGDIALRRLFSAYPGTGSVYAAVATVGGVSAVYVPASTYACNPDSNPDLCQVFSTGFTKFIFAVIFFLGFVICIFGHALFAWEMVIVTSSFGSLMGYIIFAQTTNFNITGLLVAAVIVGVLTGFCVLLLWSCFGIPLIPVLVIAATLGFLIASITMYLGLGDLDIMERNANYMLLFSCTMLLTALVAVCVPHKANMIAAALLGAFALVLAIDHYIGSNVIYVIINVVRRATVQDFNLAYTWPPFGQKDILLLVLHGVLAIVGSIVQKVMHRTANKPPFPPAPKINFVLCRRVTVFNRGVSYGTFENTA